MAVVANRRQSSAKAVKLPVRHVVSMVMGTLVVVYGIAFLATLASWQQGKPPQRPQLPSQEAKQTGNQPPTKSPTLKPKAPAPTAAAAEKQSAVVKDSIPQSLTTTTSTTTTTTKKKSLAAASEGKTKELRRHAKLVERKVTIALKAEDHLFWRGRQKRMCALVATTLGVSLEDFYSHDGMRGYVDDWKRDPHNQTLRSMASKRPALHLVTKCAALSSAIDGLGMGNTLVALYGLRLAAAVMGADFHFVCKDDSPEYRQRTVIPWLQGHFIREQVLSNLLHPMDPPRPSVRDVCRGMGFCPVHYMAQAARQDLRRMALTLIRPPPQGNTTTTTTFANDPPTDSPSFVPEPPPMAVAPLLHPDDVDQVAIHFRCGDLVLARDLRDYGFLKFDVYRRRIPANVTSIGIVTASFDPHLNRRDDARATDQCRTIVEALQSFLREAFPTARVFIRNGHKETLALAYSRLIVAQHSFCSVSTFGAFPVLASLGTGHIQRSKVNYFAPPVARVFSAQVQLMDEQVLGGEDVSRLGIEGFLQWLVAPLADDKEEEGGEEQEASRNVMTPT